MSTTNKCMAYRYVENSNNIVTLWVSAFAAQATLWASTCVSAFAFLCSLNTALAKLWASTCVSASPPCAPKLPYICQVQVSERYNSTCSLLYQENNSRAATNTQQSLTSWYQASTTVDALSRRMSFRYCWHLPSTIVTCWCYCCVDWCCILISSFDTFDADDCWMYPPTFDCIPPYKCRLLLFLLLLLLRRLRSLRQRLLSPLLLSLRWHLWRLHPSITTRSINRINY